MTVAGETLHFFENLSGAAAGPFLQEVVVGRLAGMLNSNIRWLFGPKADSMEVRRRLFAICLPSHVSVSACRDLQLCRGDTAHPTRNAFCFGLCTAWCVWCHCCRRPQLDQLQQYDFNPIAVLRQLVAIYVHCSRIESLGPAKAEVRVRVHHVILFHQGVPAYQPSVCVCCARVCVCVCVCL